jgi:hypothetical protein
VPVRDSIGVTPVAGGTDSVLEGGDEALPRSAGESPGPGRPGQGGRVQQARGAWAPLAQLQLRRRAHQLHPVGLPAGALLAPAAAAVGQGVPGEGRL